MVTLFVDTGAFVALGDEDDQLHGVAMEFSRTTMAQTSRWLTTDGVVLETALYFQRRLGLKAARRFWKQFAQGLSGVHLYFTDTGDWERAWRIAERYRDQTFSLVGCLSFAVMEKLGIRHAFAFDCHFRTYRLQGRQPVSCLPETG